MAKLNSHLYVADEFLGAANKQVTDLRGEVESITGSLSVKSAFITKLQTQLDNLGTPDAKLVKLKVDLVLVTNGLTRSHLQLEERERS